MSLALVAVRDYLLYRSNGGAELLGQLLVINIIASSFTDYISNNRSWLTKTHAVWATVLSLIGALVLIGHEHVRVLYYVLGSLGYAYACGRNVIAGRLTFPVVISCAELVFQALALALIKGLTIDGLVISRLIYSAILLLFFLPDQTSDTNASPDVRGGSLLGQVSSMALSLMLASVNKFFFDSVPSGGAVFVVRLTSYVAGAASLTMNVFANHVASRHSAVGLRRAFLMSGVSICLIVGVLHGVQLAGHWWLLGHTAIAAVIVALVPFGLFCFRVSSRLL